MRLTSTFAALLALTGCGAGTDLENPEHVRAWANSASALAVYAIAYEPIAFADGEHTYPDASCPVTSDDGTTVTIEGGCTTAAGARWVGSATIERTADGSRTLTLDGFGHDNDGGDPPTDSGTYVVSAASGGFQTFAADVHRDGLLNLDVTYAGRIEGGYTGPTVWSGTGTITRGGFGDPSGTVQATTNAQRRDSDVCSNESLSGSTTIVHEDRTLVVTYDGATDCDDDQSATYSLDGEDRGAVTGVACAMSPGRRGGGGILIVLGLAGLVLARRRLV